MTGYPSSCFNVDKCICGISLIYSLFLYKKETQNCYALLPLKHVFWGFFRITVYIG